MRRYDFRTKREAVDGALRRMDIQPFTREEPLELEGMGWEEDLDGMRATRDSVRDWVERE